MHFLNKSIPAFAGIVVLVFVVLVAGGVVIWQSGGFLETPEVDISLKNETADWKVYTIVMDPYFGYGNYRIKLPKAWKRIEHSSNFQGTERFEDGQNTYQLVVEQQKNYKPQNSEQFTDLKEFLGIPYDLPKLIVDGQQALRYLPRAGSEHIYGVYFFSKDAKEIYDIRIETPRDGSKRQEGELLFNQILSTFKFLE